MMLNISINTGSYDFNSEVYIYFLEGNPTLATACAASCGITKKV